MATDWRWCCGYDCDGDGVYPCDGAGTGAGGSGSGVDGGGCAAGDRGEAGRRTRYLRARLQLAHLPFMKTFDQFDFGFQPSIDEKQVPRAAVAACASCTRPAT